MVIVDDIVTKISIVVISTIVITVIINTSTIIIITTVFTITVILTALAADADPDCSAESYPLTNLPIFWGCNDGRTRRSR